MPVTRSKYQEGSIDRVKRANGPDVWVFRWREATPDGRRIQKKKTIGSVKAYPTESAARRAVESVRIKINSSSPSTTILTFEELWKHFLVEELEARKDDRSPTTIEMYRNNMRLYALPAWGGTPIDQIETTDVEKWLRSLVGAGGTPLADGTKCKIRNQMRYMYGHAIRHRLLSREHGNPLQLVRQGSKRRRTPDVLSIDQLKAIVANLDSALIRHAVLIAAVTGLRRSELRGLRWSDVSFETRWLHVVRGVVDSIQTKGKTERSRAGIPMTDELAAIFSAWRNHDGCLYRADSDWVFASVQRRGKSPYWLCAALKTHVKPAVQRAGIDKRVTWHTFRHSLATILAKDENLTVVQGLLRHAQVSTTANFYAQSDADAGRAAQKKMSGLFLIAS